MGHILGRASASLSHLNHGKKFAIMPAVEGTGLADVIPGPCAAFGDLFNDGKIDVVINCIDHTQVLLRNVNDDPQPLVASSRWRPPRVRAMQLVQPFILTAGGMRQRGDVMSGGSFDASNDFRVLLASENLPR